MGVCAYHPSYVRRINRNISVQASLGKNSTLSQEKRAQVIKCLPRKSEALSSPPILPKKTKTKTTHAHTHSHRNNHFLRAQLIKEEHLNSLRAT
jgi:hypothetical protein